MPAMAVKAMLNVRRECVRGGLARKHLSAGTVNQIQDGQNHQIHQAAAKQITSREIGHSLSYRRHIDGQLGQ